MDQKELGDLQGKRECKETQDVQVDLVSQDLLE